MGKCFQNLKNQELKRNFIWKEPALWCEDSIFYTGILKGLLTINQDVGGSIFNMRYEKQYFNKSSLQDEQYWRVWSLLV